MVVLTMENSGNVQVLAAKIFSVFYLFFAGQMKKNKDIYSITMLQTINAQGEINIDYTNKA